MQLRTARLCLDCEEIHDAQVCPVCASETFTFLTRWVPSPEPSKQRQQPVSSQAEIYKHLLDGESENPWRTGRLLKRGLIGLTALGVFGWVWQKSQTERNKSKSEV